MNLKFVAILMIAAVPVCAQAQPRSAAKVTKADAQNVIEIIRGDRAKTQTYCDMAKLGDQIEQAEEKKTPRKSTNFIGKWMNWRQSWVPNMLR
jgi:hypothetical protein